MDASHACTRADPGMKVLARKAQSKAARSWPSSSSASAAKRYQYRRRIIGGYDTDGLKNLFQPLLRVSDSREAISELALSREEAWIEFATALQRPYARVVLMAVLLQ